MNSSHKRQNSSGNFSSGLSVDQNSPLETSFYSLENFMILSKLMEDEIMVPTKLKDKTIPQNSLGSVIATEEQLTAAAASSVGGGGAGDSISSDIAGNESDSTESTATEDALDHYKFVRLIRNQLQQANPFQSMDESNKRVLKNKKFKLVFDSMHFHYRQLMNILDSLSNDARSITQVYRENV